MSKIDQLVETTIRLEEHLITVIGNQKKQDDRMDKTDLRMDKLYANITSLEETRVFARTIIRIVTWLCIYIPTLGYGAIKIWKIGKNLPNHPF